MIPDNPVKELIENIRSITQSQSQLLRMTKSPLEPFESIKMLQRLQHPFNFPKIDVPKFEIPKVAILKPYLALPKLDMVKPFVFPKLQGIGLNSPLIEAFKASRAILEITNPLNNLHAKNIAQIRQLTQSLDKTVKTTALTIAAFDISRQLLPLKGIFERYRKLAEENENAAEAFSSANWIFTPSIPEDLKNRVISLHQEDKARFISSLIVGYFHRENHKNLKLVVNSWASHPLFQPRMHIIIDALDAHMNKKYTLSIPALLPLIEGILNDYVVKHKLTAKCGKITNVYQAVIGDTDGYTFTTWAIAETLIYHLQNNTYAYSDFATELSKSSKTRKVTRHTVLHGITTNYHSPSNSLRIFLLLDAISALHDEINWKHKT